MGFEKVGIIISINFKNSITLDIKLVIVVVNGITLVTKQFIVITKLVIVITKMVYYKSGKKILNKKTIKKFNILFVPI